VLALLAVDVRNADIAARLRIAEKTVDHPRLGDPGQARRPSRHETARVAAERKIHHADGAPVSGR
jgi:DNA-binding CsgD family transcriptional regulator